MPRLPSLIALALALLSPPALRAHPDHTVTRRGVVEPVPSTQAAPEGRQVSITIEGERRVIVSNGLPDHPTGAFPNRNNPHRIAPQRYRFSLPRHPVAAPRPVPVRHALFGVALNGVVFDPATAEAWRGDRHSGWNYDALGGAFSLGLDTNRGHVQPSGAYHYHGIPVALLEKLSRGRPAVTLVGWAADGFPIYAKWGRRDPRSTDGDIIALRSGYRLKKGARPAADDQPGGTYDGVFVEDFEDVAGAGDLDECGGRFGVTPEFPAGTYHYVLTEDFPFIPRLFRGEPSPDFVRRPGGPPPPPRP